VTDETRAAIRRMLEAHHTLTLATSQDGAPWAATVFYASDGHCNLYFVSDRRTRHARDMLANPAVAAAINADVDNWDDVRGLQLEGRAAPVEGAERVKALGLYLAKFASVKSLFEAPRNADEEKIAYRLKNTEFWRITPAYVRLIDNGRGFGFRLEWRPQE